MSVPRSNGLPEVTRKFLLNNYSIILIIIRQLCSFAPNLIELSEQSLSGGYYRGEFDDFVNWIRTIKSNRSHLYHLFTKARPITSSTNAASIKTVQTSTRVSIHTRMLIIIAQLFNHLHSPHQVSQYSYTLPYYKRYRHLQRVHSPDN